MFLGILNKILFNFSNNPFHLQLRITSIQIVVITSYVVISSVGIKRVDCIYDVSLCNTMQLIIFLRYQSKLVHLKQVVASRTTGCPA